MRKLLLLILLSFLNLKRSMQEEDSLECKPNHQLQFRGMKFKDKNGLSINETSISCDILHQFYSKVYTMCNDRQKCDLTNYNLTFYREQCPTVYIIKFLVNCVATTKTIADVLECNSNYLLQLRGMKIKDKNGLLINEASISCDALRQLYAKVYAMCNDHQMCVLNKSDLILYTEQCPLASKIVFLMNCMNAKLNLTISQIDYFKKYEIRDSRLSDQAANKNAKILTVNTRTLKNKQQVETDFAHFNDAENDRHKNMDRENHININFSINKQKNDFKVKEERVNIHIKSEKHARNDISNSKLKNLDLSKGKKDNLLILINKLKEKNFLNNKHTKLQVSENRNKNIDKSSNSKKKVDLYNHKDKKKALLYKKNQNKNISIKINKKLDLSKDKLKNSDLSNNKQKNKNFLNKLRLNKYISNNVQKNLQRYSDTSNLKQKNIVKLNKNKQKQKTNISTGKNKNQSISNIVKKKKVPTATLR